MSLDVNIIGEATNDVYMQLAGELDIFSSPDLKKKLKKLLEKNRDIHITVDCKDLTYVDSTGLGVFMYLVSEMKEAKKKLKLVHVRKNVAKLFLITKIDQFLCLEVNQND